MQENFFIPKQYRGVVIEESLVDNRIINNFEIIKIKISNENRWHLYTILVSEKDIEELSKCIKDSWYMHFWKDRQVIAIFQGKKFQFDYDNKETWQPVIEYGLSVGVPKEQLDFPIES